MFKLNIFKSKTEKISQMGRDEIDNVKNDKDLFDIVNLHEDESMREYAVFKITDENLLFNLVNESEDENVRLRAFWRIKNPDLIYRIAKECDDGTSRMRAFNEIKDVKLIEKLADECEYSDVKGEAQTLLEAEKKDVSDLGCHDFAKAFKMAILRDDLSKAFNDIMFPWRDACPSDGNLGYALAARLYFDKTEDSHTIFMNMNDLYHIASQRSSADESMKSWFSGFAFDYIDDYRKKYR